MKPIVTSYLLYSSSLCCPALQLEPANLHRRRLFWRMVSLERWRLRVDEHPMHFEQGQKISSNRPLLQQQDMADYPCQRSLRLQHFPRFPSKRPVCSTCLFWCLLVRRRVSVSYSGYGSIKQGNLTNRVAYYPQHGLMLT